MDSFDKTSNTRMTRESKRGKKSQAETSSGRAKKSRSSAATAVPENNSSFGELAAQASLPDFLANYNMPNTSSGRGRRGRPSGLPSRMPSRMSSGMPSAMPPGMPSAMPSRMPSGIPLGMPSGMPSRMPSAAHTSASTAYNVMTAYPPPIPDYFANYSMADSARGRQARTSVMPSATYASSAYNAMVAQAPMLDYNANYAMANPARGRRGRPSGMPSATMTSSQYGAIYAQAPIIDYTQNFAIPDAGSGRQTRSTTVTTGTQTPPMHTELTVQAAMPNFAGEFAMTDSGRGRRSRSSTIPTSTISSSQYNVMTSQAPMADYATSYANTPTTDSEASTGESCRYMTRSQHQRVNPYASTEANNAQSAANQVLYPNMMPRTSATVPEQMPPPTTTTAQTEAPTPRYNTRSAAHKLPVSTAPSRDRYRPSTSSTTTNAPTRAPNAETAPEPPQPQQDEDTEEEEEVCTFLFITNRGEIKLLKTIRKKNIDPDRVRILIENGDYIVTIEEERRPSFNNVIDLLCEQSNNNKKIMVALGLPALEYNPTTTTAQPRGSAGSEETPNANTDQTPNNGMESHSIPSLVTSRPMPNIRFCPPRQFFNPHLLQFLSASAGNYIQQCQNFGAFFQSGNFPNAFRDPRYPRHPSQQGLGQFGQFGGWH